MMALSFRSGHLLPPQPSAVHPLRPACRTTLRWGAKVVCASSASLPLPASPGSSPSDSTSPPSSASPPSSTRPIRHKARADRRVLFTPADWDKHRSRGRYMRHVQTFLESKVVLGIAKPVLMVALLAAAVGSYHLALESLLLPAWAPHPPQITIEPMQLTSFALSLLLVFRTNASYSRFLEARQSFGRITTTCRDVARQTFLWLNRPEDLAHKILLARWLTALPLATMVHLRDEHSLRKELAETLLPEEVDRVAASPHPPMYCVQVITWIVHEAKGGLPVELLHRIDENVSTLLSAVCSCERILNTPIPLSYTRHTSRVLIAWLSTLPFCLWRYCHIAMVPVAALVAFVLLGVEEIGVYIEEPFGVLPLERLCKVLKGGVATMLRESMEVKACMHSTATTPATAAATASKAATPVGVPVEVPEGLWKR